MNATATLNDTFGSLASLPAQVMALKDEFARRPLDFEGEIEFPSGTVDLSQREVRYSNGETSPLSGREVALLKYLTDHPGRIITREELLLSVWRLNPQFIITRTVDMHIAKLRDKIRDNPHDPAILQTVRGRGYIWNAEAARACVAA
jgi:DNA-binding response OmpR family regulator